MSINLSKVKFAYFTPRNKKKCVRFALEVEDLKILDSNEFIAFVGHTGSGKTTLAQTLNALIRPTFGKLIVDGKEVTKKDTLAPIRKKVGLVFQFPEYQIFEETVKKDIMFGPNNFKLENKEELVKKSMEIMKITDLASRSPFSLSGGQMRKVAIAGILASNPDILILDEPTVGLDAITKQELLEFLKNLNEKENKTIIIITHDMEVVSKYTKRTVVLKKGNIMYDGSSQELFKNDKLIKECNLNYPSITRIMMDLKEKLGIDIDPYQYNETDSYKELARYYGEQDE